VRSRTLRRALAALVAAAALAACGGGGSHVAPPPDSLGTAADIPVPAAIQNLPLTKPDGSTTTLADYRGTTVMIADFLTTCTDICPMISANTVALARALDAAGQQHKVALLEISVDPQRDTAPRLRAYQKLFGTAPSNWTLLRATPADTAKLWKFFGLAYGREKETKPAAIDWLTHRPLTYDVSHQDALIFLSPDGHERYVINADPDSRGHTPPAKLLETLTAQGKNALYHPNPVGAWTVSQGIGVFSWLLDEPLTPPS
jgi:protein SCO1/2